MTTQPSEPTPIREEVIELILRRDSKASGNAERPIDIYGRPFASHETELINSATPDERLAAAKRLVARFKHLGQVEDDWKRLYDIAFTTPSMTRERFTDELIEHGIVPGRAPRRGDVPPIELMRRMENHLTAFASIFREHILPDLGGQTRAEAVTLLDRLPPA